MRKPSSENFHTHFSPCISIRCEIRSLPPRDSHSAFETMRQVESDPTGQFIRYDEVLGRGSYKVVFKAFDTHEAMEVAWNKLQVDRIPQAQLAKLQFEVDLLARLQHKNIINLFASWRGKKVKGKQAMDFITELMSSGTLKEYLTRARAMKVKVIRRWCHNLLEAISYLHEQNPPVMHRDLKCDNIFINGHCGEVKIGDLGLSGVKEDVVAQSVIGTPEFMAPELYEEAYTEKVDVYAFGMCMLEMLTMEYPYAECANPAQIFRKVFSGQRPQSFERLPNSEIKQVISACLERERRRPTARQLLEHPFFADWASDDGKMTNIAFASHKPTPGVMPPKDSIITSKNVRKKKERQGKTAHASQSGQSMGVTSHHFQRDMAVRRDLNRLVSDTDVMVSTANDGGDLRIALRIPVDGETRTIEFFFDPTIDDVAEIAREMALEFDLDERAAQRIYRDLGKNIRSYAEEMLRQNEDFHRVHEEDGGGSQEGRREKRVNREKSKRRIESEGSYSMVTGSCHQRTGSCFEDKGNCGRANDNVYNDDSSHSERGDSCGPPSRNGASRYYDENEVSCSSKKGATGTESFDKASFQENMALLEHCSKGNYDVVKRKLENGARADFADYDRRTPMHLAGTEGHAEVVELLIAHGADIDAEDRWGATPVDDAENNGHAHVVEVLKKAGAHIETRTISRDEIKSMELMQYAANGFYDMVREKLMAGAQATFADYDKRTALHLACAEGHPDVVRLLLINGADAMFKDRFGATPTDEAMKNGNEDLLPMLKQYGGCLPLKMLSKEEAQYKYGMDLVTHASRGRADRVGYLLEHGANVGFADYDKRSALHLACAEGHVEVALLLLQAGACMESEDRWGVSSVDEAVKNGHEELVAAIGKDRKSVV